MTIPLPTPLGLQASFGFGDRTGLATAGHVAALKLAAENVGELFLVNRTHSKASAVAAEIRR